MKELFDICDEHGLPTGQTVERETAHSQGIPHRTVHIWVIRMLEERRQILLQKRSLTKDSFPGMYDTSSAGHIQAGDEPLSSACRELEEELGICAQPEDLAFAGCFHIQYELEFYGKMFRDNEYVSVYVYTKPVKDEDIRIQEEELEGVEWFFLDEVYEECKNGIRSRFCVPLEGLEVLMHYLAECC